MSFTEFLQSLQVSGIINKWFYQGLFKFRGNPLTDATVFAKDPGIFFVEDNMKDEMLIMAENN